MTESPASTETAEAGPAESAVPAAPAVPAVKRRPVRKPTKPDAVLAAAVETARNGVLEVAGNTPVGEHLGAFPEAERLVTHRFVANVPGYVGWHWFATLARIPRGKDVTICEVGLLPSEEALLAPDWVPWSERVRPEDTPEEVGTQEDAAPAPSADGGAETAGGDETDGGAETAGEDPSDGGADAERETEGAVGADVTVDEEAADEHAADEDPSTPGGDSPVA